MGYKLNTPNLCASFVSGTVGPNQNIMYARNDHPGKLMHGYHMVVRQPLVKKETTA